MTQPDNLEPWQRVAAELGTFDCDCGWDGDMEPMEDGSGDWIKAEPACREIARLRAVLELVAGSLLAAQQKRGDAPCSADAHIDEAVAAVREFVPGEEYSQEAKALRMTLWASDQDRLDSQQTMEIAQLRAEVKRMRQLLGDA